MSKIIHIMPQRPPGITYEIFQGASNIGGGQFAATWYVEQFPGSYPGNKRTTFNSFSYYTSAAYLNTKYRGVSFPSIGTLYVAYGEDTNPSLGTGGDRFARDAGFVELPAPPVAGYTRQATAWTRSTFTSFGVPMARATLTGAYHVGLYQSSGPYPDLVTEGQVLYDGSGNLIVGGRCNQATSFGLGFYPDPAHAWVIEQNDGDIVYTDTVAITDALFFGTPITPTTVNYIGLYHAGGEYDPALHAGYARKPISMSTPTLAAPQMYTSIQEEFSWVAGNAWPKPSGAFLVQGLADNFITSTIAFIGVNIVVPLNAGDVIHHAANAVKIAY